MNDNQDAIQKTSLRFFSGTIASSSHELKNVLAIIRESSGLLSDFADLADKGRPVDSSRYKLVAARIEDQIQRADSLIKMLDRFARTVDPGWKTVDLNEILDLAASLHYRAAIKNQVSLESRPATSPIMATTAPLLLLILLSRCLVHAINSFLPGNSLRISTLPGERRGFVIEAMNNLDAHMADGGFPGVAENALLTALKSSLEMNIHAGRMTITLSEPER